ncbi:MAG: protein phosphatase [Planctomycetota bacterium]|nr:MAG: protein phosphatase [Planctomycetota bacterium]
MIREALPRRLWLGNAADARDVVGVLNKGIGAIVDLAMEEPPAQFPRDVVYCRFPLVDGAGNRPELVRAAVDVTASFIQSGLATLVACGGGMSRSPTIAAAALAKIEGRSLDDGLREVTGGAVHDVSTSLWAEIKSIVQCEPPI